jgi:hypothetical protein
MDTRALSMARSLRFSASVCALVVSTVCGPALAQQQGDGQVTVPFSSLSVGAQQEILALQNSLNSGPASGPAFFPLQEPVARAAALPLQPQTVMLDGRRVRLNWAIGVYR